MLNKLIKDSNSHIPNEAGEYVKEIIMGAH